MMACAACLAMSVNAQKVMTDDIEGTNAAVSAQAEADALPKVVGSFEYHEEEGGMGLGYSIAYNYVVLNFTTKFGEVAGYDTSSWDIGLGGVYRHWFNKSFFIEGQGGLAYYNSKLEYGGKEVASGSDFGIFLAPRVGLNVVKLWGVTFGLTAGYRWDFPEFKFDNIGDRGHFTVGFTFIP